MQATPALHLQDRSKSVLSDKSFNKSLAGVSGAGGTSDNDS